MCVVRLFLCGCRRICGTYNFPFEAAQCRAKLITGPAVSHTFRTKRKNIPSQSIKFAFHIFFFNLKIIIISYNITLVIFLIIFVS